MTDMKDGMETFIKYFENGRFSQILEGGRNTKLENLTKKTILKGELLCPVREDINKNTYVVQDGELELYFADRVTGVIQVVRTVNKGEWIYSMFSIADSLTGNDKHFPKVHAEALKETVVFYLPNKHFLELANKDHSFALQLIEITLSYAQKIRDIIYSISGLGPKIWKRTERYENEEPVPILPFGREDHGEDTSTGSVGDSSDKVRSMLGDVHSNIETQTGVKRLEDKKEACVKLMEVLALKGQEYENLLMKYIRLYEVPSNTDIIKADRKASDIVFVVAGTVDVIPSNPTESDTDDEFIEEKENSILGVYSAITGEVQRYQIKTGASPCTVAIISHEHVKQLNREKCEFAVRLCDYKLRQLSPVVRLLDVAISWEGIESGKSIERNESSILYVVMGRLRKEIQDSESNRTFTNRGKGDFGRGKIIGAEDILYKQEGSQKLYAVRYTRVARIPTAICDYFMMNHPADFFEKIRNLLKASRGTSAVHDISTVACISVSDAVPLEKLVKAGGEGLGNYDVNYMIWNENDFREAYHTAPDEIAEEQIKNKMNSLENDNDIDFYLVNCSSGDRWRKLVIEQADLILVVGVFENGYSDDNNHKILREQDTKYSPDKVLLLLHKPNEEGVYDQPSNTWKWLEDRDANQVEKGMKNGEDNQESPKDIKPLSHLHIRCPKEIFETDNKDENDRKNAKDNNDGEHNKDDEKNKDNNCIKEIPKDNQTNTFPNDFARLVRYILGQSYGLVLGGGGARGFAHLGVIEEMVKEEKVYIDMVGGTSMGAFVGASYCMSTDVTQMEKNAKTFRDRMSTPRKFLDITFPYASCTSGYYFNKILIDIFGETEFADLWIPYFNITADITESKKVVNTKGPLWQYVRASMSLAAIVPPLCDPVNGHYLLDGGSVDNLPAGEMKQRGCKTVVAIDVSGKTFGAIDVSGRREVGEHELRYGTSVSALWLLIQRYSPWNAKIELPDILTVVTKLACISGEEELKRVKSSKEYIYVRPEGINNYGTLQFEKYNEIKELGKVAGRAVVAKWIKKAKQESNS